MKFKLSKKNIIYVVSMLISFPLIADINLTKEERKWISDNPIIDFTGNPNWLPYEAFKKDGKYIGIVSEHLKLIEKVTGLEFNTIPSSSWPESLNIASAGKVSVISGDAADVKLNKHFTPVDTYIKNPVVIIMRGQQDHLENLNSLKGKK